jgi:hypothetical protein
MNGSDLLTPLGEDVEAEHPLARAGDELEQVNLLLGVRALVAPATKALALSLRLGLLDELPQGEVRVLSRPAHHRAELHRLLPQLPAHRRPPQLGFHPLALSCLLCWEPRARRRVHRIPARELARSRAGALARAGRGTN